MKYVKNSTGNGFWSPFKWLSDSTIRFVSYTGMFKIRQIGSRIFDGHSANEPKINEVWNVLHISFILNLWLTSDESLECFESKLLISSEYKSDFWIKHQRIYFNDFRESKMPIGFVLEKNRGKMEAKQFSFNSEIEKLFDQKSIENNLVSMCHKKFEFDFCSISSSSA